jgi:hypothetical protein
LFAIRGYSPRGKGVTLDDDRAGFELAAGLGEVGGALRHRLLVAEARVG